MHRSSRYTGIAAVGTVWTALTLAAAVSGFDLLGPEPLSYLGGQGASRALFSGGLALTALLLLAFHQHVRRRFPVSLGFSLAMITGLAGQLLAAFVPIGGHDTAHGIHTAAALVLGVSLPVLMWRFAAAQRPGPWRQRTYRLFWFEVLACTAGLYLSARKIAPVAEILPASIFHLWIAVVTFGHHSSVVEHLPGTRSPLSGLSPAEARRKRCCRPAAPSTSCVTAIASGHWRKNAVEANRAWRGEVFQLCPRKPGPR